MLRAYVINKHLGSGVLNKLDIKQSSVASDCHIPWNSQAKMLDAFELKLPKMMRGGHANLNIGIYLHHC
jgi:hypothetical protein